VRMGWDSQVFSFCFFPSYILLFILKYSGIDLFELLPLKRYLSNWSTISGAHMTKCQPKA
jgi:hypothetical protein